MEKKKRIELAVLIGVLLLAVILYIFRDPLFAVASIFGRCEFHERTGYHCPGCGCTRALKALLKLRLITSFRDNPIVLLGFLFVIGCYLELAFDVCGKKIRLVPRKLYFWIGLGVILIIFYIIRNFIPVLAPIPETIAVL